MLVVERVVVWGLTHSVDAVTTNWTVLPANWMVLRDRWEFGHATGAILDLVAFVALVLSVLVAEKAARVGHPDEASGGRGAPLRFMAVR